MFNFSERKLALLAQIAASPSRLRDLFAVGSPPEWAGSACGRFWQIGLVERDRAGVYTITAAGREALANGKTHAPAARLGKRKPQGTRGSVVRTAGGGRQVFRSKRSG